MEITVQHPMITLKSVAWGEPNRELFKACQEAIRSAVQTAPERDTLRNWLESRTKLALNVEFHLKSERVRASDIDSLLSDLLNPIVEGACGPRPEGKPIPQTKDALFWKTTISKVQDENEKIFIRINPLQE